jgi:histone H3/H4
VRGALHEGCPSRFTGPPVSADWWTTEDEEASELPDGLDCLLLRKALSDRSSERYVFGIDPRNGGRFVVDKERARRREGGQTDRTLLRPAPLADAMCKATAAERRCLARQALTATELSLLHQESVCVDGDLDRTDQSVPDDVDDALISVISRRRREVAYAQESTYLCFPPQHFWRMVQQYVGAVGNNPNFFSSEALELFQTACEGYLLTLCTKARRAAAADGRRCVLPVDLETAQLRAVSYEL